MYVECVFYRQKLCVRSWENSPSGTFRLGSSDSLHFTSVAKKWFPGTNWTLIKFHRSHTTTDKSHMEVLLQCPVLSFSVCLMEMSSGARSKQFLLGRQLRRNKTKSRGIQPVYKLVNLYEHIIDTI